MKSQALTEAFEALAEAPGGIARLRELVLQLAVRGRLVPQDPREEPATEEVLLSGVSRESAGKTLRKRGAGELTIRVEWAQVRNWLVARLGDVLESLLDFRGRTPKKLGMEWGGGDIPALSALNVRDGSIDLSRTKHFGSQELYGKWMTRGDPARGDILFTMEAPLGNVAQIPDERLYLLSQRVVLLKPRREVIAPEFLAWVLRSPQFRYQLLANRTGTTAQGIRASRLVELDVPLPPLAEQHRIAAKVDELMALLDQLETARNARESTRVALRDSALAALRDADTSEEVDVAWGRIAERMDDLFTDPADVNPLRQTVLQLAVRGRLVPQDGASGTPEHVAVGEVVELLNGYAFKSSWYCDQGVRLVRNQNVGHGTIEWADTKRISDELAKDFERFRLRSGDIVLSLDRPIISTGLKVATVRDEDLPCLLLQRVACPRPRDSSVEPRFLLTWLLSPEFVDEIDPGRSNGVPHISTRALEKMKFRLPPLAEQRRIVAKVDQLMTKLDRLEQHLGRKTAAQDAFAAAAIHHLDA